jgi:hypothetical protein
LVSFFVSEDEDDCEEAGPDVAEESLVDDESDGSAAATGALQPLVTAIPTPSVTANAPTRPTYRALPMPLHIRLLA